MLDCWTKKQRSGSIAIYPLTYHVFHSTKLLPRVAGRLSYPTLFFSHNTPTWIGAKNGKIGGFFGLSKKMIKKKGLPGSFPLTLPGYIHGCVEGLPKQGGVLSRVATEWPMEQDRPSRHSPLGSTWRGHPIAWNKGGGRGIGSKPNWDRGTLPSYPNDGPTF